MTADATDSLLVDLDRSRERTIAAFRAAPAALDRPYAPGKWTGLHMLFHIVDCETVLGERVRRLLAEAKPLVLAFDENRWNDRLAFTDRSPAVAEALYAANRAALCELVATVSADEWRRSGVHTEAGRITVAELVTKVVWHNEHHLEQVEAAIHGRTWAPQP